MNEKMRVALNQLAEEVDRKCGGFNGPGSEWLSEFLIRIAPMLAHPDHSEDARGMDEELKRRAEWWIAEAEKSQHALPIFLVRDLLAECERLSTRIAELERAEPKPEPVAYVAEPVSFASPASVEWIGEPLPVGTKLYTIPDPPPTNTEAKP